MKDFFDGLIQHIKNDPIEIVYNAIIFLLGILFFFLLLYIFLFLRRWYYTSKIRRLGQDFSKVNEYVRKQGKPINHIQRFFLNQFGEIVENSWTISIVLGLLLGICPWVLLEHLQLPSSVENKVVAIWILLLLPFTIYYFIEAFHELVKHARIILFAFWCGILAIFLSVVVIMLL
ncbi:MAG: hypothetical protein IKI69_08745 [Oscillospiraceae bacterium]|nr:hypothetical protein [Oscillospiraceae bacterium]